MKTSTELQQLLDALNTPGTSPEQRLRIGDKLAKLGDLRPGVGLDANGLPDIDWVHIPSGVFIYDGETQQRHLDAFYIARYPVTNAQFQVFIDADGYQNKHYWQGLDEQFSAPENPKWKQSNRPRESVSWYEAIAFCRWLSEKQGIDITLASEHQWERAASGCNGCDYPWGRSYNSGCANVNETVTRVGPHHLEQTSAVGLYPHGASVESVFDLSGNVWEWCLNEHHNPDKSALDGNLPRVLRGGSWFNYPVQASASFRHADFPVVRCSFIGFRVVCSSPVKT